MRPQSRGPLTTMLMLVPLIVLPLLAVFGIPEFVPLSASDPDTADGSGFDSFGSDVTVGVGESARHSAKDLLAPFSEKTDNVADFPDDPFLQLAQDRPASTKSRHAEQPESQWSPPADALDEWKLDPDGGGASQSVSSPSVGRIATATDAHAGQVAAPDGSRDQTVPDSPLSDQKLDTSGRPGKSSELRVPFHDSSESHSPAAADRLSLADDQLAKLDPRLGLAGESFSETNPSAVGRAPQRFVKHEITRAVSRSRRTRSTANASRQATRGATLTWRSAVRRLNDLGIRDFQLQPGEQNGEFHFSCFFTPSDNPRITHRFEAEATEPLRAVEKVLAQIERWLAKR